MKYIYRDLLEDETRKAATYLNYANKVNPDPHTPMGPTWDGLAQLWPVSISDDGKRVGLSYMQPKREVRPQGVS